jgi:hypothetical protein
VPSQRRTRQALHVHIVRLQAAVSCVSHAVVVTDQQEVWLSEQPMALGRDYTLILQQELHATLAGELRIWRYNYRIADANDQESSPTTTIPADTATTTCTCRAGHCRRRRTRLARLVRRR